MAKIVIPKDYDTYKIVRAFNERLRIARKQYGDDSYIVKAMKEKAQMVSELDWSESGLNIKKGKENIDKINDDYLRNRVIKYIKENTALDVIKDLIPNEELKKLNHLKGQARIDAIRKRTNSLGNFGKLLGEIWGKLQSDEGFTPEDTRFVYEGLKSDLYKEELNKYLSGEITVRELAETVINENGKYRGQEVGDLEDFNFDDEDPEAF